MRKFGMHPLSGSIPPELGKLTNVVNLYLTNNQLSGSIPPELGNLTNLVEFILR
jgi:Leucine-rich repeat (LRR) protein